MVSVRSSRLMRTCSGLGPDDIADRLQQSSTLPIELGPRLNLDLIRSSRRVAGPLVGCWGGPHVTGSASLVVMATHGVEPTEQAPWFQALIAKSARLRCAWVMSTRAPTARARWRQDDALLHRAVVRRAAAPTRGAPRRPGG